VQSASNSAYRNAAGTRSLNEGNQLLSRKEAVFLDLDGTLFDTRALAIHAFKKALEDLRRAYGISIPSHSDDELVATVGCLGLEAAARLLPDGLDGYADEFCHRVQHHEREFVEAGKASLFAGVPEFLSQLRAQGFRTFLASNCSLAYRDLVCGRFGLFRLLDQAYCIEMYPGLRKSDMVRAALLEQGVTSGFMVGDRSSDMEAGLENGLTTVACAFGFGRPEELRNCGFHCKQCR